jgi:beta-lactamase regulating signal transducer with metallopeptidase domain
MWTNLDCYPCMYVVQSVVHSVIALFLIEMSLKIWKITDAREQFRYRLQALVMPLIMFPLFQFVNPDRGSFYFIEDTAIFSSSRWMRIDLFDKIPLIFLFILFLLTTSILTIVQEIIPVIKKYLRKDHDGNFIENNVNDLDIVVSEISSILKINKPDIYIVEDENPLLSIGGTKNQSIVISEYLLKRFNKREMRSAIAHELAHIVRRSNATTLLVFLIRIVMFYNPVSLLVFRRLIQDDEHVCDDITLSITNDPEALASALSAFYSEYENMDTFNFSELKNAIENSSHNILLKERILRLENKYDLESSKFQWGKFIVTCLSIFIISYLVV